MRYNPDHAPDPVEWQATDEGLRVAAVEEYHRRKKVKLPDATMHAAIHAVVETQILMGEETPAAETLERLLAEGLTRHDAVHAIGSVLAKHIYAIFNKQAGAGDPNEPYFRGLKALTAEGWRRSG